jgi:nucleoid-associated protein YgaU
MARVLRGLGALVLLVVGLVGIPAALVVLGGNPFPSAVSWEAVQGALLRPDDGAVLLGLITLVGWLAWLVFAVSILAELASLLSGCRIVVRLPGLAGPQRLAAGLLMAVVALAPALHSSQARAEPITVAPTPAPASTPDRTAPDHASAGKRVVPSVAQAASEGKRDTGLQHVVELGDDLWSLAERYYGEGRDWRQIARANPDVLTGGPDRLQPGWKLTVPGVTAPGSEDRSSVTVQAGETLSSIAERELGEESDWRALYRANRDQLDDPDEIDSGMRLAVPSAGAAEGVESGEKSADARGPNRGVPSVPLEPERRNEVPSPSPKQAPPEEEPSPAPPAQAPVPPAEPEVSAPPVEDPARPAEVPASAPAPTAQPEAPSAESTAAPLTSEDVTTTALGLTGVGALLAAGLVGGLALRRRTQLQTRPLGRRIVHPSPSAQRVEVALGRRQQPMGLRTLDLALRSISAHCLRSGEAVPRLSLAAVAEDELELTMVDVVADPPPGFTAAGRSWRLDHAGADHLRSIGVGATLRPYPALVTVGIDPEGRTVLADLESFGLLGVTAERSEDASAVLAAMALELAFSPWADEMILTLVGEWPDLPGTLDKHNVSQTDDVDELLDRVERRAAEQRAHQPPGPSGHVRIDPDLADPWAPEVVLLRSSLSSEQHSRLRDLMTREPRPTLAVVAAEPVSGARWLLRLQQDDMADGARRARLEPLGLELRQQHLAPPAVEQVMDLVTSTTSTKTTAAPWWEPEDKPDPPPDNVALLGARPTRWGAARVDGEDVTIVSVQQRVENGVGHPPLLQLLGPVDLTGATGQLPPRAGKQCLEYCGWLLEHPGTTAQAMASALVVAEGTRRSNMSRLRTWLGTSSQGEPYLPDAYTGRISLHPSVSSDWQQLQLLTLPAVNKATDRGLRAALDLVRGAPLADAAPGQWHWAEELRTDMISAVRDVGVEFANRALRAGDVDLARWAASRALVAAPGDELLLAVRVRTEHQAGNAPETERLALQLAAQSRALGVDLDASTVVLLQQVMEGRVRARMA